MGGFNKGVLTKSPFDNVLTSEVCFGLVLDEKI